MGHHPNDLSDRLDKIKELLRGLTKGVSNMISCKGVCRRGE